MKPFDNLTLGIISFDEFFVIYKENGKFKSTSKALTQVFRLYEGIAEQVNIKISKEGEGINKNGVFNGLFGFLQRKEIDLNIFPVSLSATDIPICNFSSSITSDALKIVTFPEKKQNIMVDLLTLTAIIPKILTGLLFLLILMLSLIITIKVIMDENNLRNFSFIKKFFDNLWLVYSLFWREYSFNKSHHFIVNILITLFHFFNLFLFAYFTSVFSTNLVVSVKPFQVDTFEDIFDPRMANHKPIIRRSCFLAQWILNPTSSSIERLRDLIMKFGFKNCFIPDDYSTIIGLRDLKNTPKFGIMSERFAVNVPKFIAEFFPNFPNNVHVSKGFLFPNLLALTYVNRYDHKSEKKLGYLHHWIMKYCESGIIEFHLARVEKDCTKSFNKAPKTIKENSYNDIKTGNIRLLFLSLSVTYTTIFVIWLGNLILKR